MVGTGSIHAKSAAVPLYWSWTWVVTVPSPWMKRMFSATWFMGTVVQKKPPQARAAGMLSTREQNVASSNLAVMLALLGDG